MTHRIPHINISEFVVPFKTVAIRFSFSKLVYSFWFFGKQKLLILLPLIGELSKQLLYVSFPYFWSYNLFCLFRVNSFFHLLWTSSFIFECLVDFRKGYLRMKEQFFIIQFFDFINADNVFCRFLKLAHYFRTFFPRRIVRFWKPTKNIAN